MYIKNRVLEEKKEKRLLGLVFDSPRLTWKAHVNYLKTNCTKRVALIKTIASTKWGASSKIMRQFYILYIQSKIGFGSIVYSTAAESHLQKLEIIQNSCMRMILGARKSTPILSLQAEAHVPPLKLQRQYLIVKEYIKLSHRVDGDYTKECLGLNDRKRFTEVDTTNSFRIKAKEALKFDMLDVGFQ